MKALVFSRKPARYAAAVVAGRVASGAGAKVGPLRLHEDHDIPDLPGPGWRYIKPRLAGICGSDLATIDGTSSRYFEPIVSFPFVPGHEIVADLVDPANPKAPADGSQRVILEPVLGCVARNISPVCHECAAGHLGNCTNIAFGDLAPGLQSGFCCDTGGGWSTMMVAHESQLHAVPDHWTDEMAVMVEPTACAVHAALASGVSGSDAGDATVVILGAGTLGLLTLAAVRSISPDASILVVAKHPEQRDEARTLGADHFAEPSEIKRAVRRLTGSKALTNAGPDGPIDRLTGGASVVFDCVGSNDSLADAIAVSGPRGRIMLVGMAGHTEVDLTGLWHKELQLVGTYAYGTETPAADGTPLRTFDLAMELVEAHHLGRLVTATYPLSRYTEAISHAANAGRRGAVKIAFDLRPEKERDHL